MELGMSSSSILAYAHNEAFSPRDIEALSSALEDVCDALSIDGDEVARKVIAVRILELARRGERDTRALSIRVLHEANGRLSP
jgi:hypothetical protein